MSSSARQGAILKLQQSECSREFEKSNNVNEARGDREGGSASLPA
jgi:hypothetical protein